MALVTIDDGEWEWVTLYGEIGSRAFSELAAENSTLSHAVIVKRAYRAGMVAGRPKASLSPTSGAYTRITGNTVLTSSAGNGPYTPNEVLTVQHNDEILMTQFQRYSKKGNLMCRVLGGSRVIAVPKQDVLCSGNGDWDDFPIANNINYGLEAH